MQKKIKYLVLPMFAVLLLASAKPAQAFYLEVPDFVKNAFNAFKIEITKADETSTEVLAPAPMVNQEPAKDDMTAPAPMVNQEPVGNNENLGNPPPNNEQNPPPNNNMSSEPNSGPNSNNDNKGDSERFMKDVQRGTKQMERNLKKFEDLVAKAEKGGTVVSDEIKQKVAKLKDLLQRATSATTAEELRDFDMGEANELMQELEQSRQDVFEKAQRLKDIKRQMRGPESGLKSFEKQLIKTSACASEDTKAKMTKLRETINAIKSANTWDEVEGAGLEDLGDQFGSMDEIRQRLEACSRWPQTLKQINRELNNFQKNLKRAKSMVARLAAKGVDLTTNYSTFESAVEKLKSARDAAVEKMNAGQSEEAFDLLQDDFFGQMDDAMQSMRVIEMMSNLGKFSSDFRREMVKSESQVRALQKKKIDVSELKTILAEAKAKGNEIIKAIKLKEVDLDAVMSMMQDMEEISGNFDDKMQELTGESDDMPWESGPQQLKSLEMPSGLNKYMKPPATTSVQNSI